MTDHITLEQLDSLRKRTLSGPALLAVDDHLAACPVCRARAGSDAALEPLQQVFQGLDSALDVASHPGREELADYVDSRQTPAARARIDAHLLSCESCRADVSDLSDFRKQIQSAPPRRQWLGPAIGIAASIAVAVVLFETAQGPKSMQKAAVVAPAVKPWQVALNDGGSRVGLDPQGAFVWTADMSAADRELVENSLRSGAFTVGSIRGPVTSAGVLRGDGTRAATFRVLTPVGSVVFSQRPELHWEAFPDATSYRVTVFDANFDEVASSPELHDTHWTVTKALARGRSYAWQVTALAGGKSVRSPQPPDPEARFKVLDAATAAGLEPMIAQARPSHLLIAAKMAAVGLKDEAREQLDALAAENPDAAIVGKLRESLK